MSKILNIITHPNPILRQVSLPLSKEDICKPEFLELYDDMTITMHKKDGIGLAAPQIGKNFRIVVIHYNNETKIMINPVISKKSWAKKLGEEGCLSVPNTFGNVYRHLRINCNYLDEKGNKQKIIAEGMHARIIQHEVDHLDGILFIDKTETSSHA